MNDRQAFGNLLWMAVFLAALTSPFWGHWLFGVGAILMAVASELRMEHPGFHADPDAAPRIRRKTLATKPEEYADD